jgi:hypothetical protein
MAKKKEETRKESLTVWASPAWQLKKEGPEIKIISGCGFLGAKKEGLVELEITVEEK